MTVSGPRGGAPKNRRLKALFDSVKLDETPDGVFQAFRYYVVNRMAYGSGRVNYSLPSRLMFGSSDNWGITTTDRLELAATALEGVRITNGGYLPLLEEPGTDVWVLIDAPYVRNSYLKPTSQMYQHNFTLEDHTLLAEAVKRCEHNVMLCYDDDKDGLVRSLYPEGEFWIHPLQWSYCGTTRSEKEMGRELVICNYPPASY
jgi:site-specific DNA-adenine methylase